MAKEKQYFITDIESGERYPVSKKVYEAYLQQWEAVRPKISGVDYGKVLCHSTGGDTEQNTMTFEEMWNSTKKDTDGNLPIQH